MGIKNLLQYLKGVTSKKSLSEYKGKTAAIDASCWIHKSLSLSYGEYGDDRR